MKKDMVIYSLTYCPYCVRAKNLMKDQGIDFEEIIVASDDDKMRVELSERSGMRTFPQIFYKGELIGGFQQLNEAHESGALKKLLGR